MYSFVTGKENGTNIMNLVGRNDEIDSKHMLLLMRGLQQPFQIPKKKLNIS